MAKAQVNSARVADMASRIRSAVLAMADPHREMLGHNDAKTRLAGEIMVTKLDIARDIASLSNDEDWLPDEIDAACKRAGKGNEDESDERTQKTIGVICSEMRVVASPRVRGRFPALLQVCQEVWDAEALERTQTDAEDRGTLDQPVYKFAKRLYNLVITMARAVKNEGVHITTTSDLVDYCREHDPDHNEEKIATRIASVVNTLQGIISDFDNEEVKLATEYLQTVTAKDLLASRRKMLENIADDVGKPAPVTPTTAPVTPVVAPAPQAPTSQIIDDLLNDNLAA